MSAAYDTAQKWLENIKQMEEEILPIVDPAMETVFTDALNAIKTVLATTWGGQGADTPEAIDAAARAALDAKFPGK